MQGETIRNGNYHRCIARTIAPGSPALADHPKTVSLCEDKVVPAINEWISTVFTPTTGTRPSER